MTASGNCPQCGTARQGTMRFCASCGFDYWKAAESPADAGPPASPASPVTAPAGADAKGNRRLGCAAIAVIAVIVIGVVASLGQGEDPPAATATGTTEATPSPTPTAGSAAPTEVPSPVVSVPPEPAFENITLNGTGNAVPRFEIPEDAAAIAEIAHTGVSNFAVWTVDGSGDQTDLLVNTIGTYTGTVLFDESAGSHTAAFKVEADGAWTIVVKPVTEAFAWDGVDALSGTGDDVAILQPRSAGLQSTSVTHDGDGNFAIWAYSTSDTDLLVNEIGAFSGEVLLPDGTFLFEITANGRWTMSPPQ